MARKRRLGPRPDNPRAPKRRRIEKDDDVPGSFLTPALNPSAEAYPTPDLTPDSKSTRTLEADQDAHEDKLDIPEVEKDEVLRRFSVAQLKRHGYINYREKPVLAISNTFKPEVTTSDLSNPVHPVFQRSNWLDTDDATWSSLQPSLRLASRIIAEPALQAFFYDIVIRPHYYFDHKELEKLFRHRPTRFSGPAVYEMSFQEHTLKILQQKMSQMRHAIEWGWSSFPSRIHGCTVASYARPGIGGPQKVLCSGSEIRICESYKTLLLPGGMYSAVPLTQKLDFGQEEGLLRARLLLAITLVHEFSHALFLASQDLRFESFYRDHRISEIGCTIESILFDGVVDASGNASTNEQLVPGVYGYRLTRWPGAHNGEMLRDVAGQERGYFQLAGRDAVGKIYHTHYLVPMTWIHQFFTDEFWDRSAARSSLGAYHPERKVGFRLRLSIYDDDNYDSPLPPQSTLSPSPADEDVGRTDEAATTTPACSQS